MIYIGLDPSFKEYGVTKIDTLRKTITLDSFGTEINQKKHATILDAIPKLTQDLISRLSFSLSKDEQVHVGMELDTAITARNQAACYALDADTYNRLKLYDCIDKIDLYTTNYIGYVQFNSFKEKSKSNTWLDKKLYTIHLVEEILQQFYYDGWTIERVQTEQNVCGPKEGNRYPKCETITSGEADSCIIALRQLVKADPTMYDKYLSSIIDDRIKEDKEID